jgi:hypothetical protein
MKYSLLFRRLMPDRYLLDSKLRADLLWFDNYLDSTPVSVYTTILGCRTKAGLLSTCCWVRSALNKHRILEHRIIHIFDAALNAHGVLMRACKLRADDFHPPPAPSTVLCLCFAFSAVWVTWCIDQSHDALCCLEGKVVHSARPAATTAAAARSSRSRSRSSRDEPECSQNGRQRQLTPRTTDLVNKATRTRGDLGWG